MSGKFTGTFQCFRRKENCLRGTNLCTYCNEIRANYGVPERCLCVCLTNLIGSDFKTGYIILFA